MKYTDQIVKWKQTSYLCLCKLTWNFKIWTWTALQWHAISRGRFGVNWQLNQDSSMVECQASDPSSSPGPGSNVSLENWYWSIQLKVLSLRRFSVVYRAICGIRDSFEAITGCWNVRRCISMYSSRFHPIVILLIQQMRLTQHSGQIT